jgi:hypothetical protein
MRSEIVVEQTKKYQTNWKQHVSRMKGGMRKTSMQDKTQRVVGRPSSRWKEQFLNSWTPERAYSTQSLLRKNEGMNSPGCERHFDEIG